MAIVNLMAKKSRDGSKRWWYFEYGRGSGQRIATNIYTWTNPRTLLEKNYNKETLGKLQTEAAQKTLDLNNGIAPYLPSNKVHSNFLDFYKTWVADNKREGNRHVEGSFNKFKSFLQERYEAFKKVSEDKLMLAPEFVTEDMCSKFQEYLTKHHTGDTPMNYFSRFKRMIRAATKEGYFKMNPCEDVKAKKGKKNQSKDVLEKDEFEHLCTVPCENPEVKKAFLFSFLTGLRGQTLRELTWGQLKQSKNGPYISFVRGKTGNTAEVPLLKEAMAFLPQQREEDKERVFKIPRSTNGYNKALKQWMKDAGIKKHITGHCARHSLGTILKESNVSDLLIADILGHTSTKYVRTYSRMSNLEKKKQGIKAAMSKSDPQL